MHFKVEKKMVETSKELLHQRAKRWKANLDTDIENFCWKESIYPSERGKGILNDIGSILGQIYDEKKAKTIGGLLSIPKSEFLEYGDFYGRRKKAEECWRTMNNILRRHRFRMYVKPIKVSY